MDVQSLGVMNLKIVKMKDIVNNGGFMLIKSVQWLLPSYNILYPDTLLYKQFKSFYDDCYIHDIKLTQRLFWQECNQSIYDNFEIIDILGSGSIGQVYKAKLKRISLDLTEMNREEWIYSNKYT